MVAIHPFRALRYGPALAGGLGRVLCPPYDVIDPDEQERLYQRSPYNAVRLVLGKILPGDSARENRYTRALRDFTAWRQSHALEQDPVPALYLVDHAFSDGAARQSRLGFIALLELGDGIERMVYRHEATLAAPKQDRTRLLEEVPACLEPIFCVYPDEGGSIQQRLRRLAQAPATAEAAMDGETIRLWAVTDPAAIRQIREGLGKSAVLIADGHHRFEVACAARSRYGALMAYFVSMAEPALVVRPIHRIIQQPAAASRKPLEGLCRFEPVQDLAAALRWLDGQTGPGRFGWYDGAAYWTVTVRPEALRDWLAHPPVDKPLAELDVLLLHGLLLPRAAAQAQCAYAAEASRAVREAAEGTGRSAWLLRGIPLTQVYALASQGLTLPPKSTYFYPKVPSGLTIHPLT
jgi:uncharacterized protein (DUF1015 family)